MKKPVRFSHEVNNNIREGRSIFHDINYIELLGQEITTTITYDDGTQETFTEYKPMYKFHKLSKR